MPAGRPNVIDSHDCKLLIIRELLKKTSHAKISAKFGISIDALARYQKSELRRYIVNGVNLVDQERAVAQAESDKAVTDLVMDDITKIRGNGRTILDAVMKGMPENGQLDCDPKGFAVVARELRELNWKAAYRTVPPPRSTSSSYPPPPSTRRPTRRRSLTRRSMTCSMPNGVRSPLVRSHSPTYL
jgi:hypothetical protein